MEFFFTAEAQGRPALRPRVFAVKGIKNKCRTWLTSGIASRGLLKFQRANKKFALLHFKKLALRHRQKIFTTNNHYEWSKSTCRAGNAMSLILYYFFLFKRYEGRGTKYEGIHFVPRTW
jgi:hypothetical protein